MKYTNYAQFSDLHGILIIYVKLVIVPALNCDSQLIIHFSGGLYFGSFLTRFPNLRSGKCFPLTYFAEDIMANNARKEERRRENTGKYVHKEEKIFNSINSTKQMTK